MEIEMSVMHVRLRSASAHFTGKIGSKALQLEKDLQDEESSVGTNDGRRIVVESLDDADCINKKTCGRDQEESTPSCIKTEFDVHQNDGEDRNGYDA